MSATRFSALLLVAIVIACIVAGPGYLRWWDAHRAAEQKKWEQFPIVRPAEQ